MNDYAQLQIGVVPGWFPKVRRCPKSSTLRSIIRGVRGRDDEHRGTGAFLALADVREDFDSAQLRKIQVEKKQLRTASQGVRIDPRYESDGLLTILQQMKFDVQAMCRDRLPHQEYVRRVVLNQDDGGRRLNPGW